MVQVGMGQAAGDRAEVHHVDVRGNMPKGR